MLKSMTGFGVAEAEQGDYKVAIELRSVNHRFLDIAVRLPRTLLAFEELLKARVRECIDRGRVSLTLTFDAQSGAEKVEVNHALVQAYVSAGQQIATELGLAGPVLANAATIGPLMGSVLAQPDVMTRTAQDLDEKRLRALLLDCLDRAIQQADEMKQREGRTLGEDLGKRLDHLQASLENVEAHAPQVAVEARDALQVRLAKLLEGVSVDEARLAQEVAILADRTDITEECVRLASHLKQFRATMESPDQGARRMGFLLQEMHREVNTIGSKTAQLAVTSEVLLMKEEIEKLREQVQNLE
jgi:uncharacterized protein (TIGR00255 family)